MGPFWVPFGEYLVNVSVRLLDSFFRPSFPLHSSRIVSVFYGSRLSSTSFPFLKCSQSSITRLQSSNLQVRLIHYADKLEFACHSDPIDQRIIHSIPKLKAVVFMFHSYLTSVGFIHCAGVPFESCHPICIKIKCMIRCRV